MPHQTVLDVLEYIDGKLDEAKQAVADLTKMRTMLTTPESDRNSRPATSKKRQLPKGSIRERVLHVLRKDYTAVADAVANTGLQTRQVRGVITAPDVKDHIRRRKESDGTTLYKFVENENSPEL